MPVRFIGTGLLAGALLFAAASGGPPVATNFPDPAVDVAAVNSRGSQTAVFAGGCFWCTEAVFQQIAGYAGGDKTSAHYDMVSTGKTGHAECVEITFNPAKVTYGQLLKVFFHVAHNPTERNHQGPDYGPQYRSAIFYTDLEQKRVAEAYIRQLDSAKVFNKPIVTEVTELKGFYPAEQHHQNFCRRNPNNPYVMINATPKVQKTQKEFPDLVKK
jgi:peptide-methionine (S)-S-oxide reductase